MRKCFIVNFYIYYNIYIHWHIHIYIYIYIYIKNSGKPETVHRYWPVSEIYRTGGQTGTASGTVLTSLYQVIILFIILKNKSCTCLMLTSYQLEWASHQCCKSFSIPILIFLLKWNILISISFSISFQNLHVNNAYIFIL